MKFRAAYVPTAENAGAHPASGPTRTKQEFKQECDVNFIVKNAQRGIMPRFNTRAPEFADVSDVPDLAQAFELAARAEEAFMTLPAELRKELNNDPRRFNEISAEQFERFGLMNPKEPLESPQSLPSKAGSEGSRGGQTRSEPAAGKASKKPISESDDE